MKWPKRLFRWSFTAGASDRPQVTLCRNFGAEIESDKGPGRVNFFQFCGGVVNAPQLHFVPTFPTFLCLWRQ